MLHRPHYGFNRIIGDRAKKGAKGEIPNCGLGLGGGNGVVSDSERIKFKTRQGVHS